MCIHIPNSKHRMRSDPPHYVSNVTLWKCEHENMALASQTEPRQTRQFLMFTTQIQHTRKEQARRTDARCVQGPRSLGFAI